MSSVPTVIKQPAESRLYTMEFAALMAPGETVASIVSVAVSPTGQLAVGSSTYEGTQVQFRLTDGVDGRKYKVTVRVTTSQANTLEGDGFVNVVDL